MTHGTQDYGNVYPRSVVSTLNDMAELAVRLGAVNSIDRLGDVLFFDDFSNGKGAWEVDTDGLGGEVSTSSLYFKHGGFSLMLKCGSDSFLWALTRVFLSYPEPSKVGFEVNFSFDSDIDFIYFVLEGYSESSYFKCCIKFDLSNKKLWYYGSDGVYHEIASLLYLDTYYGHFHSIKFVVDLNTGYYNRLRFNGITYNLSTYQFKTTEVGNIPVLECTVHAYSVNGSNGIAYIDSVIVTRNEP